MKILIIEDDEDTRSFVAERLREKNFIVDEEPDGKRGLYVAKANHYDLILLDYGLPGKNGFEICQDLRESGNMAPIIMISVVNEFPHKVSGLNFGADDYITKPFFFDELYARIMTVLRRPAIIRSNVTKIGDLTIDVDKQLVTRGKNQIYLTKKEFALLEYLSRHNGNVVTRSMISDHVWESDIDPFSNTIETHILNLRKKVDTNPRKKLIRSIPGRGYRLDSET